MPGGLGLKFNKADSIGQAVVQFLQISGLDGEDDGIVPFVQLEWAVLRVCQVDRVILPRMEEDIFSGHRIVIDVSVSVGDVGDVFNDDDGLVLTLRQAVH